MFLDVKELATHAVKVRKTFLPGTIDYRTQEFRQVEPLHVRATVELHGQEIHIFGHFSTSVEQPCARCLEPVVQEIGRDFDLSYQPVSTMARVEEIALRTQDTEVGFYRGDGLFLSDVLAERVILALPLKPICKADCRGLCPHCGVNLNEETCQCVEESVDPRLKPLARLKEEWWKKQ